MSITSTIATFLFRCVPQHFRTPSRVCTPSFTHAHLKRKGVGVRKYLYADTYVCMCMYADVCVGESERCLPLQLLPRFLSGVREREARGGCIFLRKCKCLCTCVHVCIQMCVRERARDIYHCNYCHVSSQVCVREGGGGVTCEFLYFPANIECVIQLCT